MTKILDNMKLDRRKKIFKAADNFIKNNNELLINNFDFLKYPLET